MPSSEIKNRDYISWSQYWLYKQSPEKYKRIYIDGEKGYVSDEMEFGSNFHEGLDKGSDDIEIEAARLVLPNYSKREYEITEIYKGVKIKGVLDLFDKKKLRIHIGDIKTGKVKWTQERANNHGQLKFYDLLCLAKYGVMAKEIKLYWFETKDGEEGIQLTGNHKEFKINNSLSDLLIFFADVKRVNDKIIKLRKKYGKKV